MPQNEMVYRSNLPARPASHRLDHGERQAGPGGSIAQRRKRGIAPGTGFLAIDGHDLSPVSIHFLPGRPARGIHREASMCLFQRQAQPSLAKGCTYRVGVERRIETVMRRWPRP